MSDRNNWGISISTNITKMSNERLLDMQKNGVGLMELTCGHFEECADYHKTSKQLFSKASDYGVKIRSFHLPFFEGGRFIDPASVEKSERDRFMNIQTPLVKTAAESGVEIVVVHPSGEPYDEATRVENHKCSIDTIARLNDIAKASGIKLAVENLPRTCIGRNCEEIKAYAENIKEIYYCFDSNHSLKDSNIDFIKTMGERIIALHISDYDFVDERHMFPGEGKNCWQDIISALENVGYAGTWNYEVRDAETTPVEQFVNNYNNILNGIIK